MAGPCTYRISRCNSPLNNEDKIAEGSPEASTKSNNIHTPTPAALHIHTLIPASAPPSNNELFQQFMKAYLEN